MLFSMKRTALLASATMLSIVATATAEPRLGDRRRADSELSAPGYQGSVLVDPSQAMTYETPARAVPKAHNPNLGGKRAAYFTCNSRPWGFLPPSDPGMPEARMDALFGAGNWDAFTFESGNTTPFTGGGYDVIWMNGGDGCATELEAYLNANRAAIEGWVADCGGLFLEAAPNEDNGMLFWSDGTTLLYGDFGNTMTVVNPSHPI